MSDCEHAYVCPKCGHRAVVYVVVKEIRHACPAIVASRGQYPRLVPEPGAVPSAAEGTCRNGHSRAEHEAQGARGPFCRQCKREAAERHREKQRRVSA
jgi:hypothetical protein